MSGRQRGAGIVLNYASEGVKVLTTLFFTPVMLRLLGQREYGLYQLAVSVAAWLSLLDLGFGSSYLRQFVRCREEGELSRLNGMFGLIFGVLALLCLAGGGLLAAEAQFLFGDGLSEQELAQARRLLWLLAANGSLTLGNALFDSHISARERFSFQRGLRLIQSLLNPLLSLRLFLLGCGAEGAAVVSLALSAGVLAVNGCYCRRKLHMALSFRGLELDWLKGLWSFAFFIFLNQIIDQVNWSVDRFLLGRLLGTAAVAVYGIGAQINSLYIRLSTAVACVFFPEVNRLAAKGEDEALSRLLARVGTLEGAILFPVLSGFLLFGRPFLALWAGPGFEESYTVALWLMVPVTVPLMQNIGIEIQRAKGKHRTRSVVYALLAAGNVALSRVLIPYWGCTGAAVGTGIALILGNGLFMNWYYSRRLGLDMVLFWKDLARLLPVWIPTLLLGLVLAFAWEIGTWPRLILAVGLYCGGYLLLLYKRKKGQAEACPRSITQ